MRAAIFALLCCAPALGQGIHAGVVAGVPFTQYFETGPYNLGLHGGGEYSAATRRYTVGALFEWDATRAYGLQTGVLYHRMGYVAILEYHSSASGDVLNTAVDVKGNSWDFPLVLERRFGRAYLAGGGVLRYVGPVRGLGESTACSLVTGLCSTAAIDTTEPNELRKRFYPGVTAAAGIQVAAGRLRLRPELRYTRWAANISGEGGALRFAPNQVEFLLALMF